VTSAPTTDAIEFERHPVMTDLMFNQIYILESSDCHLRRLTFRKHLTLISKQFPKPMTDSQLRSNLHQNSSRRSTSF
jgi:hypothetical protein